MSWTGMQIKLAETHAGNITMHLICIAISGQAVWHFRGIIREIKRCLPSR